MKKPLINITLSLVLITCLANDCQRSEDDDSHLDNPRGQALEERNSKLVNNEWVLTGATRNEVNVTSDLLGLELRLEGEVSYRDINVYGVYTTKKNALIFEPQDSWQYQSGNIMSGLFISDVAVDYSLNDQNNQLVLEFDATEGDNPDQQRFTFTFQTR